MARGSGGEFGKSEAYDSGGIFLIFKRKKQRRGSVRKLNYEKTNLSLDFNRRIHRRFRREFVRTVRLRVLRKRGLTVFMLQFMEIFA